MTIYISRWEDKRITIKSWRVVHGKRAEPNQNLDTLPVSSIKTNKSRLKTSKDAKKIPKSFLMTLKTTVQCYYIRAYKRSDTTFLTNPLKSSKVAANFYKLRVVKASKIRSQVSRVKETIWIRVCNKLNFNSYRAKRFLLPFQKCFHTRWPLINIRPSKRPLTLKARRSFIKMLVSILIFKISTKDWNSWNKLKIKKRIKFRFSPLKGEINLPYSPQKELCRFNTRI